MIQNIPLERILFLDIETVPQASAWEELSETEQYLWDKKTKFQRKDEVSAEEFYERAGIMAEFGKIICITIGMVEKNDTLKIKSFSGHDEKKCFRNSGPFSTVRGFIMLFSVLTTEKNLIFPGSPDGI